MTRLVKKAMQSTCKYKVAAIAFDKKGDVLGISRNKPRFHRYHGSLHAEMLLMARYKNNIREIIICRVNKNGKLRPIRPCPACTRKAEELGIKIRSISG